MVFRAFITLVAAGGLALGVGTTAACGGGGEGYKMPVTSPLVPWKKPDRTTLVPDEATNTAPTPKGPPPDMGDDDDDGAKNPCGTGGGSKSMPPKGATKSGKKK